MNTPQDPEAAETVQTTSVPAVDLPRLVRLCRFCAQKLDLWMEWKSNHCLYDHATSTPCDECQGANLRNPESIFTVKFRLPNDESIHPESKPNYHE
jgi:hypothetical protein